VRKYFCYYTFVIIFIAKSSQITSLYVLYYWLCCGLCKLMLSELHFPILFASTFCATSDSYLLFHKTLRITTTPLTTPHHLYYSLLPPSGYGPYRTQRRPPPHHSTSAAAEAQIHR
jgi:hypothetical protein